MTLEERYYVTALLGVAIMFFVLAGLAVVEFAFGVCMGLAAVVGALFYERLVGIANHRRQASRSASARDDRP